VKDTHSSQRRARWCPTSTCSGRRRPPGVRKDALQSVLGHRVARWFLDRQQWRTLDRQAKIRGWLVRPPHPANGAVLVRGDPPRGRTRSRSNKQQGPRCFRRRAIRTLVNGYRRSARADSRPRRAGAAPRRGKVGPEALVDQVDRARLSCEFVPRPPPGRWPARSRWNGSANPREECTRCSSGRLPRVSAYPAGLGPSIALAFGGVRPVMAADDRELLRNRIHVSPARTPAWIRDFSAAPRDRRRAGLPPRGHRRSPSPFSPRRGRDRPHDVGLGRRPRWCTFFAQFPDDRHTLIDDPALLPVRHRASPPLSIPPVGCAQQWPLSSGRHRVRRGRR